MTRPEEAACLFDQDGLRVTADRVSSPSGDYPIRDIRGVASRVQRPVLGPVLLGLLGTLNLAIAFEGAFWLDFVAAAVMLGGGMVWWLRGTRYVLSLELPAGRVDAWYARREDRLQAAQALIRRLIEEEPGGQRAG